MEWKTNEENPCGIMVSVLEYNIVVSEIELLPGYYVYFWTNTLRKSMKSFITSPAMG